MELTAQFDIPVAIFLFKRSEKAALIIDQLSKIAPQKIYLIGDGPRNETEQIAVAECRKNVESHITWQCEVIRNYASENRGVYENIAGGAKWVFKQEKWAIFLEDDNLPAISFFQYCKDLLEKYEFDTRILWICGTNYMSETVPEDGSDYYFTQLMLPCGWASWSYKFNRYYDGDMSQYRDKYIRNNVKSLYRNKLLYKHDFTVWNKILKDLDNGKKPTSWDYQMAFSLRVNSLFGIAPRCNQIMNIGADMDSIHGGTSTQNIMTARFCEVPINELKFPLNHPKSVMIDERFEKETENKIILPFRYRLKGTIVRLLKNILRINPDRSIRTIFLKK